MKHDDELARGRAIRETVPRSSHRIHLAPGRDPLAILESQNADRLQELVGLRMQRMTASPFAFYRGSAALMAADLATEATTGLDVVACGDSHISNFGFFASPQRIMVFDLNDFDEAAVAPWEWDLKRLVTSVVIGARECGFSEDQARDAALAAASTYRKRLDGLMQLTVIERYYRVLDANRVREQIETPGRSMVDAVTRKARKRTSEQVVAKMTVVGPDGLRTFLEDPILTRVPIEDRAYLDGLLAEYRTTVAPDIALVLEQHELTDVALRVVGVGSVGTRCYLLLLTGPKGGSLVLQVKEAGISVLNSWGGRPIDEKLTHGGNRVVANQRILQAVSDPFLGHLSFGGHDFYVRQFRDMKGSIDLATLSFPEFRIYAGGCGMVLARAHAQSPVAPAISGYLGKSDTFDKAVVDWGFAYADQALADYERVAASYNP